MTTVSGPPSLLHTMGKCSVESAVDCPASTHGRSRFAGVICAATCFILTCSIIIYTVQWERRSGIENRQQMESIYELKNIVDGLKGKLDKYNSSVESVDETFDEVRVTLDNLMENMHQSQNSVTDLNDTVLKFKTSLDELKEIFEEYRNEMGEMKRKQVEMKEDLDKFRINNNVSGNHTDVEKNKKDKPTEMSGLQNQTSSTEPHVITVQPPEESIILENAIDNLQHGTVPTLKTIEKIIKEMFEHFSSKMENGKMNKTELGESILMYREKVSNLKSGLRYPFSALSASVQKIIVLKAKDEKYQVMIEETKKLFRTIHSSFNVIKENIVELQEKLKQMVEYMRSILLIEPNEQIPEDEGDELDYDKLMGMLTMIIEDLQDIKLYINAYNNHILALEIQMDNPGSVLDGGAEFSFQEISSVPDGIPVELEDPIWCGVRYEEGSGFKRKGESEVESPTLDSSSEEFELAIEHKTDGTNFEILQSQDPEISVHESPSITKNYLGRSQKVSEPEDDFGETKSIEESISSSMQRYDTYEGSYEDKQVLSDVKNEDHPDLQRNLWEIESSELEENLDSLQEKSSSESQNNGGLEDILNNHQEVTDKPENEVSISSEDKHGDSQDLTSGPQFQSNEENKGSISSLRDEELGDLVNNKKTRSTVEDEETMNENEGNGEEHKTDENSKSDVFLEIQTAGKP